MPYLPEDIWHLIFAYLGEPCRRRPPETWQDALSSKIDVEAKYLSTLARLARVNRNWNFAAERSLYGSLFLRPHRIWTIDNLLEGLLRRPERGEIVRCLRIRATWFWNKRGSKKPCSSFVIAVARSLNISEAFRKRLISGLHDGLLDAKFAMLLCLCPNVEAVQLRDCDAAGKSIWFDLLAESAWFGGKVTDERPRSFLSRLRFVRAGWKELSNDYFGDTIVAQGCGTGLLVVPIMYNTLPKPILQLLPRLDSISLHRYEEGKRPQTQASIARQEEARNRAWMEDSDYKRTKWRLCRHFARALDWDMTVDLIGTSGKHLRAFTYDPIEYSPFSTRKLVFDILPGNHLPALRHVDIARDMLYICAKYHPLQHKLPTTLHSLHVLRPRPHRNMVDWPYMPRYLYKHVVEHDQQLLNLLCDSHFAALRYVKVDLLNPTSHVVFSEPSRSRHEQMTDWEMHWSTATMLFTRK